MSLRDKFMQNAWDNDSRTSILPAKDTHKPEVSLKSDTQPHQHRHVPSGTHTMPSHSQNPYRVYENSPYTSSPQSFAYRSFETPSKGLAAKKKSSMGYAPVNTPAAYEEHHEMTRMDTSSDSLHPPTKNPFEGDDLKDPFRTHSGNTANVYDYAVDHEAETDESARADELEKRFRRNERARRKLEKRLPRFHWTKLPYFTILVTLIQVIVFIVELAKMANLTGSAFQTKPYFNPMLGPSTYLLINMGARYVPCMHKISGITTDTSIQFPCPNSTSTDTDVCNLAELCGLSGIPVGSDGFKPDQWYRVITPIFLHAGFLHIGFNLLLQVSMGASIERAIGGIKYAIIYLASGISGFLLGANFSPYGIASTGASGALFGIIATNFLLFIYCGRKNTNLYGTKHYKLFIFIMVLEVIVAFVLGLLPGMDNFSHIGGFCMGVLLSILLLPDPSFVYIDGIYTYYADTTTFQLMLNRWNPMDKHEDKIQWKVLTWAGARVVCLVLAILYFALLFKNLYSAASASGTQSCKWCKYINCLPVNGWCDQGELDVETSTYADSSSDTATSTTSPAASSTEYYYSLVTTTSPGSTITTVVPSANKRDMIQAAPTGDAHEQFRMDLLKSFEPDMLDPSVGQAPSFTQTGKVAEVALVAIMAAFSVQFFIRRYRKN